MEHTFYSSKLGPSPSRCRSSRHHPYKRDLPEYFGSVASSLFPGAPIGTCLCFDCMGPPHSPVEPPNSSSLRLVVVGPRRVDAAPPSGPNGVAEGSEEQSGGLVEEAGVARASSVGERVLWSELTSLCKEVEVLKLKVDEVEKAAKTKREAIHEATVVEFLECTRGG